MKTLYSTLLIGLCAVIVSACGGGSGDGFGGGAIEEKEPVGAKQGFIAIEERYNKRIVDAWFSQGVVPNQSVSALWEEGGDRCVELQTASFSENNRNSYVGTRWRDTLFAGESISISSRAGEVSRLVAQRVGDAVLYASAERWIPAPLPDDAQIMVTGSDEFPAFDAIPLPPLTRLVRTAPADGVTSDLSAAITWDVSAATDDAIEVTVSASENTRQSAGSVKCWISDSGEFVLPEVVRQALPQNLQSIVTLVRTRKAIYDSGSAQLHVSQSSYP